MRGFSERAVVSLAALCLGVGTVAMLYAAGASAGQAGETAGESTTPRDTPRMRKYVTDRASFVVYIPAGWLCREGIRDGFRTVSVTDPSGQWTAALSYGSSPAADTLPALAKRLVAQMGRQYPDLSLRVARKSNSGDRIVVEGAYTDAGRGTREFRWWLSRPGADFTCLRMESPAGKLAEKRQLLLTILSNIRITKGAFTSRDGPVPEAPLAAYRLGDGSAAFKIPRHWRVQELGAGQFIANDPTGAFSFISANVTILTPRLGVQVPGVPVSPFLRPHQALQFVTGQQGIAANMRFLEITPRPELAAQMGRVYTTGPVLAEDFMYTCTTRAGRAKGYTLGICFGSHIGANWSFRHLTVAAPEDRFDAFAPVFADMLHSYTIDQDWAREYVIRGAARLRQLQQQTSRIVARNAEEIRQVMQAAYDERQRSLDYIDYQRTNYIRGEQDWVSAIEGGAIYHTDTWGTKNTATGEYWEGQPYDYVHFKGDNPKYREQMTPIDTRELWQRHIE